MIINEKVPCVFYDLVMSPAERVRHYDTMDKLIKAGIGGGISFSSSGPVRGEAGDNFTRHRFFLEAEAREFYERVMEIYEPTSLEEIARQYLAVNREEIQGPDDHPMADQFRG